MTQVVADEVRRYRKARGMSVQQLSDAVSALGVPLQRPVLSNLENGRRHTVSVDEVLALAAALNVPPVLLVAPLGRTERTEVLPGVVTSPWDAARWIMGAAELPGSARRWSEDDYGIVRWFQFHQDHIDQALRYRHAARDVDETRAREYLERADEVERSLRRGRDEIRRAGLIPPDLPPELAHVDVPAEPRHPSYPVDPGWEPET